MAGGSGPVLCWLKTPPRGPGAPEFSDIPACANSFRAYASTLKATGSLQQALACFLSLFGLFADDNKRFPGAIPHALFHAAQPCRFQRNTGANRGGGALVLLVRRAGG